MESAGPRSDPHVTLVRSPERRLLAVPRADAVWHGLLLAVLLGVAAVLRFGGLGSRGLLYWDEGKYALEGLRMLSLLSSLPGDHLGAIAGKAVGTAKPTHALLIAASYAIFGVHDYAPLFLDGAASMLQIGVLYLLGRRIFGQRTAIVATACLAVSGYDIIYARSALSESDADLLFLLGVSIWWLTCSNRSSPFRAKVLGYRAVSGLVLGAAFTTNYRLIIYMGVLIAADLLVIAWTAGWRASLTAALAWSSGLIILPGMWQVIGVIAQAHHIVLFRNEITHRPSTYLAEALFQLRQGKQSAFHFSPLPYLEWYVTRQGWILSLLLLAGLTRAVIERTFALLVAASLVIGPYLVFVFAPYIVPRNLDTTLPFTALLAAVGLFRVIEWLSCSQLLSSRLVAIVLVLVAGEWIRLWPLTGVHSGLAEAAAYVQRDGHDAFVVNEVMVFYLRDPGLGCDAPALPSHIRSLGVSERMEDEYAVIDSYWNPVARYLARHASRVAGFPAPRPAGFGEDLVESENGVPPDKQTPDAVSVFSLDDLPITAPSPRIHTQCTQERVA